jgi:hypothetical protein
MQELLGKGAMAASLPPDRPILSACLEVSSVPAPKDLTPWPDLAPDFDDVGHPEGRISRRWHRVDWNSFKLGNQVAKQPKGRRGHAH